MPAVKTKKKTATKATKKKVVNKKVAVKKTATKKPKGKAVKLSEAKSRRKSGGVALKKEYVVINEYDKEFEAKNKLTWLIVGIIGIALLAFWFWTLGERTKKQSENMGIEQITAELAKSIDGINTNFDEARDIIAQTTKDAKRELELAQIKNEIMQQIQANLNSANWPMHTSEVLGLSLQYPEGWSKAENANELVLTNIMIEDAIGEITITKYSDDSEIELGSGRELAETDAVIGEIVAPIYEKPDEESLDWVIVVSSDDAVYKISAVSDVIYEPVVKGIFRTIEFK